MSNQPWQSLRDLAVSEVIKARLTGLTPGQQAYLETLRSKTVTFCLGPAGTGKTYLACGVAAQALKDGRCERIVLSRPLVTCGKGVGFLKGTLEEKVGPYMRPLLDAFGEFFGAYELERHLAKKTIEMLPLDLMRGCSLKGSHIICDEAQNAEFEQLHMLVTRLGKDSRLVVTGDAGQTDLSSSGFAEVVRRVSQKLAHDRQPEVAVVRLGPDDIVRHHLVRWMEEALTQTEECWWSFPCPHCETRCWFDDDGYVEQARCHACSLLSELWDAQGCLVPKKAGRKCDERQLTLPRKP